MTLASAGPVTLGAAPVRVRLAAPADGLRRLRGDQAVFLVLRGLTADKPPEVLYRVTLGDQPVGDVNFYAAVGRKDGSVIRSFDVTAHVRRLASDAVDVSLTPSGTPAAGANAVIGRVELAVE